MDHIAFFSYARQNLDPYLSDFFDDLCSEISPATRWGPEDDRISFRDRNNLRLMEHWKTHIDQALQSSAVLVCMTSVAYLSSKFCGKEYYVFDQRRRQGAPPTKEPPPVILPVIWAPVVEGLPEYLNEVQFVPANVSEVYRELGLRHLARFDKRAYRKCVTAFAQAITRAWRANRNMKPLSGSRDFSEIPNMFADGEWEEAAGPNGWLSGPEVANFVFASAIEDDIPHAVGRYGKRRSEWRPYLPTDATTILEHAKTAARKQSLRFREIQMNTEKEMEDELDDELDSVKRRRNLSVVIADPEALPLKSCTPIGALEKHWWDGSALILPCENEQGCQNGLNARFPVLSQLRAPNVKGPVRTSKELELTLELTLTDLRTAVTRIETGKKEKTGEAPAMLTGTRRGDT
jgi:hypothetical protein